MEDKKLCAPKTQAPRLIVSGREENTAFSARVAGKSDLDDPQDRLGNYFE